MDIEPLIGILRGWDVLHGYTHTVLGTLVIGAIAGFIGKPVSSFVLKRLQIPHYQFTWSASFLGAFIGTFSHVLLDAIMHWDMSPWRPITSGNKLLGVISMDALHLSCIIAAVIGAIVCIIRFKTRGRV
ncbi:MAG: hypothetical protein FWG81_00115 [Betaproteobacteria bacterium]|nr:hypothetical protein [Betaproteobacteria bacterium]